jgi:hypothetical protein
MIVHMYDHGPVATSKHITVRDVHDDVLVQALIPADVGDLDGEGGQAGRLRRGEFVPAVGLHVDGGAADERAGDLERRWHAAAECAVRVRDMHAVQMQCREHASIRKHLALDKSTHVGLSNSSLRQVP